MATLTIVEAPIFTLTLTTAEAQFIKALMQNPMLSDYSNEPVAEKDIRENIFTLLKDAGVR